MKRKDLKVPIDKLRYVCDPDSFGVKDTTEITPIKNFVGQKKAIDSLQFGLEMEASGYNIFVTGASNSGKGSLVRQEIEKNIVKRLKKEKVGLKDICYVCNFENSDRPNVLIFNRGEGKKFKKKIEILCSLLKSRLMNIDTSKRYMSIIGSLETETSSKTDKVESDYKDEIRKLNFITIPKEGKYIVSAMSIKNENKPMSKDEFALLGSDFQEKITNNEKKAVEILRNTKNEINELNEKLDIAMDMLKEKIAKDIIENLFGVFKYSDSKIINYLAGLKEYTIINSDLFVSPSNNENNFLVPFKINLLVDNSRMNDIPFKHEKHPNFTNLFGRIDKSKDTFGYYTDHTMIKPGSLALLNGGYIMLYMEDILADLSIWIKLKKTLEDGKLKIEDQANSLGFKSVGLNPEPIPVDIKVIIISGPDIYGLLTDLDKDFLNVFKVKAEFNSEMNRTQKSIESYAAFISFYCKREKFLPFDTNAIGRVVEHGIRMAGNQKKISTRFGKIKDLIIEADYWAKKDKASIVNSIHIATALEKTRSRVNLTEKKYQEMIMRGSIIINTRGKKIGEINALPVVSISEDFSFGFPSKVTAQSYKGKGDIVSIQRSVGLSGSSHNQGVEILSSYIKNKYGSDIFIPFSFSICFEQIYNAIDGDSASVAELLVILSELSRIPIDQCYAITGSMNQKGAVQPIGAVNEKIEGFFDICNKQKLTGKQGVFIPIQNVDDLMLREDIVDMIKKKKFHIYAFSNIDEAIELMFRCPADKFHKLITNRLKKIDDENRDD